MNRSFDISDQRMIINSIVNEMSTPEGNRFFLINGFSGSGKSHTGLAIGEYWAGITKNSDYLYMDGELDCSQRSYLPFTNSLIKFKSCTASSFIKKTLPEIAKGIPYAGDFASFTFDAIFKRKHEIVRFLNEIEQLIVLEIDKLFNGKELVIIADNIHWWDESSLRLLQLLISGELEKSFPVCKKLRLICIQSSDQTIAFPKTLEELLGKRSFQNYQLNTISQQSYLETLKAFGYTGSIDQDTLKNLFSFTGGHLVLIKSLAEYLNTTGNADFLDVTGLVDSSIQNQFITSLFSYRLKALGASENQVISILEYASVIGLSFTKEEISCISKESDEELSHAIERAKSLHLLGPDKNEEKFSHSIIRDFFLNRLQKKRNTYIKAFSKCLAILRPADYYTRAKYATDAGDIESSVILSMIGHFQDIRNGNVTPDILLTRINRLSGDYSLHEYFIFLCESYRCFLEANYEAAIMRLSSIEDSIPKSLLAEKYYLLAICLSRSMRRNAINQAINGLTGLDAIKSEEAELWLRLMSTLLVMYTHLADFENAKRVEREIMIFLSDRLKFDNSAVTSLHIIRRKSACLHLTEIAIERTEKSVKYFLDRCQSQALPDPFQYYMALTNHAGNLIVLSSYLEAFACVQDALNLVNINTGIYFPKQYMPANNYIISGLRTNKFSTKEALKMFGPVIDNAANSGDLFLVKSNLACVYVMDGNIKAGEMLLSEMYRALLTEKDTDLIYTYYPLSNLSLIKFLQRDRESALAIHTFLDDKIPNIPDKDYLIKKHEIMKEVFLSWDYMNFNDIESKMIETYPNQIGKAWAYFSSPLIMSDLQFWSES